MSDHHKAYLDSNRKREIEEISQQVLLETNQHIPIDPEAIATHYEVLFWHDTFKDTFKAEIMYDGCDFAIAINCPAGTDLTYGMNRYSSAHELGHYCLPEQKEALMEHWRNMKPNIWSWCEFTDNQEREVEYFAACLLMPAHEMKQSMQRMKFGAESMVSLSKYFNVSMEALALRFTALSSKRTAVICSKQNKIAWKNMGNQLNDFNISTINGTHIHPQTLASQLVPTTPFDTFEEREIRHDIWLKHKENHQMQLNPFKEIVFSNMYRNLTIIQEMDV
jgi:Zn-dependent peptidase ImmA (M78 family)